MLRAFKMKNKKIFRKIQFVSHAFKKETIGLGEQVTERQKVRSKKG